MRIVAYCRVSTEKDEQLESMQNQKDFFDDFAIKYNHELVHVYADEGISGKQMENRAQFICMLNDSKSNLFDMVVVKDISRFARNTVDFLTAVRKLKSRGIEVQFLSNNQTILGNSEFILTIFSAMAQEESANLSSRVKFGKKMNAKKGRVPNIIYGYDKINTFKLIINQNEADVVRQMFDMYCMEGYGTRKISIALNDANVPSKKGVKWTPKSIRRILANPIYIGILINNKIETVDFLSGKRTAVAQNENYIHQRPELRIISDEQYSITQKQILERQKIYKNNNPGGRYSNAHTFSTLIKCAVCGYSFTRKIYNYKNTYIRWRCSGNSLYTKDFCNNNFALDEQQLLGKIKEYLSGIILNKETFADSIYTDFNEKYKCESVDIKSMQKQSKKLKHAKEKYKDMYTNDLIDMNELKNKCSELDVQILLIEEKLSKNQQSILISEKSNKMCRQDNCCFENLLQINEFTNLDMRKIIDRILVHPNGEVDIVIKVADNCFDETSYL